MFNTCKHFIRTVSNLVYDEKNVEDISTEGEDYIYDELCYVCTKNPITPRRNRPSSLVVYDPPDLRQDQQYDRYNFYRRYRFVAPSGRKNEQGATLGKSPIGWGASGV